MYRQRILDRALLVGNVRLVNDVVVPEPEHAGGRLAPGGHALDGERIALLEWTHRIGVGQLLPSVS